MDKILNVVIHSVMIISIFVSLNAINRKVNINDFVNDLKLYSSTIKNQKLQREYFNINSVKREKNSNQFSISILNSNIRDCIQIGASNIKNLESIIINNKYQYGVFETPFWQKKFSNIWKNFCTSSKGKSISYNFVY